MRRDGATQEEVIDQMRKLTQKQGQGTLEYILVLVVILLAIIIGSAQIKTAVSGNLFNAAQNRINKAATALDGQR